MKNEIVKYIISLIRLFAGLFLCAFSIVLSINANLGLGPWNAFHMGISLNTALTVGNAQILTGLVIIMLGVAMKQIPGLGTLLNMYFIGTFVDLINKSDIVPKYNQILPQLIMLLVSMVVMGYGSYIYMSAQIGAGPRDGVMVALVKKTGKPVWLIRNLIEAFALTTGVIMGAPIGIGTVIYTIGIGYSIEGVFRLFKYNSSESKNRTILDDYYSLREMIFVKEKN